MSVKIRLQRLGKKKRPFYRIVAIDSKKRRDGLEIERLGWYNPSSVEISLNMNEFKNAKLKAKYSFGTTYIKDYHIFKQQIIEKTIIADSKTINIKLVPHRGCWVGKDWAFLISTSIPDSKLYTTRCSAPWY